MKVIHYSLGMIASLAVIVMLLISSFEIGIYSNFDWYQKEYEKYDVLHDLQMEMDDVMDVTEKMMSYLKGNRNDLVIETTVDGQKREFFNDREKAHMVDVKNLFLGGLKIRLAAFWVFVISIVSFSLCKGNWKKVLPGTFLTAMASFLLVTGVVGVLIASDFNRYFILFHEVFFDNDLWLLNPETDLMIRMLPEGFFFDMVFRIGCVFILCLSILTAVSAALLYKQNRIRNTYK